jgi:hypothetical protein
MKKNIRVEEMDKTETGWGEIEAGFCQMKRWTRSERVHLFA